MISGGIYTLEGDLIRLFSRSTALVAGLYKVSIAFGLTAGLLAELLVLYGIPHLVLLARHYDDPTDSL
jgi:hypothetical protein